MALDWIATVNCALVGAAESREGAIALCREHRGAIGWVSHRLTHEHWTGAADEWDRVALPRYVTEADRP